MEGEIDGLEEDVQKSIKKTRPAPLVWPGSSTFSSDPPRLGTAEKCA